MPPTVEQTLRKAKRLARRGQLDLAAREYRRVLARYPQNKRASEGLDALGQGASGRFNGKGDPSSEKVIQLIALYRQSRLTETLEMGEASILLRASPQSTACVAATWMVLAPASNTF